MNIGNRQEQNNQIHRCNQSTSRTKEEISKIYGQK